MENITNAIKIIGAAVTALITYVFGGLDVAFGLLVTFITLDYITGVIAGIANKELSSAIGYRGLLKKIGILIVVATAHLIGTYLGFEVRVWVIGYYIANEGISILENTGRIGVPYPEKLIGILKQLKDKDGEET